MKNNYGITYWKSSHCANKKLFLTNNGAYCGSRLTLNRAFLQFDNASWENVEKQDDLW